MAETPNPQEASEVGLSADLFDSITAYLTVAEKVTIEGGEYFKVDDQLSGLSFNFYKSKLRIAPLVEESTPDSLIDPLYPLVPNCGLGRVSQDISVSAAGLTVFTNVQPTSEFQSGWPQHLKQVRATFIRSMIDGGAQPDTAIESTTRDTIKFANGHIVTAQKRVSRTLIGDFSNMPDTEYIEMYDFPTDRESNEYPVSEFPTSTLDKSIEAMRRATEVLMPYQGQQVNGVRQKVRS